jgi:hypothetical protein
MAKEEHAGEGPERAGGCRDEKRPFADAAPAQAGAPLVEAVEDQDRQVGGGDGEDGGGRVDGDQIRLRPGLHLRCVSLLRRGKVYCPGGG